MVYQTNMKNWLASQYAAKAAYLGALTALGTSNAVGTETSGGSPAYARKSSGWGTASGGVINTAAVVLDIASGAVLNGLAFYDVATGTPTYYDQQSIAQQQFSSQGTLTCTVSYTQT